MRWMLGILKVFEMIGTDWNLLELIGTDWNLLVLIGTKNLLQLIIFYDDLFTNGTCHIRIARINKKW